MTDLLTVTRTRVDGSLTRTRLTRNDDDYYVTVESAAGEETSEPRALSGVSSPAQALRRTGLLHVARLTEHTDFSCPAPDRLPPHAVREAIRATTSRTAGRDDAEAPKSAVDEWTIFDEADTVWSTRHQITVNGVRVFAVPKLGLVVEAENYLRPYDSWPELLAFSWDSSDYAGVGVAGFGTSGLFRPHPALLAIVEATDESLRIGFERISPRTSNITLISRGLGSGIFSGRLWPHLVLAAHGLDARDIYPDDQVRCSLPTAGLRRLTRPLLLKGN